MVEIPCPPCEREGGHFDITLHDPERWAEPRAAPLPWLPLTMVFDLPHLRASLLAEPGTERQEGLFMLDTGATLALTPTGGGINLQQNPVKAMRRDAHSGTTDLLGTHLAYAWTPCISEACVWLQSCSLPEVSIAGKT